jgi:hypothetical protein
MALTRAQKCMVSGVIPVRYSIAEGTIEHEFCCDLNIAEDGVKWKDAIEFVMAGNKSRTLRDFWAAVRDEYLREGGAVLESQVAEIMFE